MNNLKNLGNMKLFKGYQRSKDVENLSKNIFKRKKDIEKTFYSRNLSKKNLNPTSSLKNFFEIFQFVNG